jgi:hypothetical protein
MNGIQGPAGVVGPTGPGVSVFYVDDGVSEFTIGSAGSMADIPGMTITPGEGDYMAFFYGMHTNDTVNASSQFAIYHAATGWNPAVAKQDRVSQPGEYNSISCMKYVPGLLAGQSIRVTWKSLAGTSTVRRPQLLVVRVA